MAEKTLVAEKQTVILLPFREYIVGIYRDKRRFVVRKFELKHGIRICLDEQYVLNEEDAIIIQNILIQELNKFSLN